MRYAPKTPEADRIHLANGTLKLDVSIGKILLNYVKDIRSKLLLNVYQKNIPAISFYQREGFEIQYSGMDEATGEKDYVMVWQQK